jgi:hypothetical protein
MEMVNLYLYIISHNAILLTVHTAGSIQTSEAGNQVWSDRNSIKAFSHLLIVSKFTLRLLRMPPSVRTTRFCPQERITNVNILHAWGAQLTSVSTGAYLRHWSTRNLKYLVILLFKAFTSAHGRLLLAIFLHGTSCCKDSQGVKVTAVRHDQILLVHTTSHHQADKTSEKDHVNISIN